MMNRSIALLTILAFLMMIPVGVSAQEQDAPLGKFSMIEVQLSIADPQGLLGVNMGSVLPGFRVTFLTQYKEESPHFAGVTYSYLHHESQLYRYTAVVGGDLVDFDQRTSSNVMDLAGLYRFFIPRRIGPVTPFVDVSAGLRFLYTFTSDNPLDGGSGGDFGFDVFRVSPLLGVGMGLQVPVAPDFYINVKASYALTLSTSYWSGIDVDAVAIGNSRDAFVQRSSPSNMAIYELGVTYWW